MKLKLRKKKKSYLEVKWVTEPPRCSGICCSDPVFTAEGSELEQDDMSDEEYEKRIGQIFELFGSHESY
jgi:hypothetical protein